MIFKKLLFVFLVVASVANVSIARDKSTYNPLDTTPIKERFENFLQAKKTLFDLKDPSIIEKTVEYDPITGNYVITEKIGNEYYRAPTYLTFKEYADYRAKEQQEKQFQKFNGVGANGGGNKLLSEQGKGGVGVKFDDPLKKLQESIEKNVVDRLFGGNEISIIPQGNVTIGIGAQVRINKAPTTPPNNQLTWGPDFPMEMQVNVTGKVGEKLSVNTSFNTGAAFAFDNQIKLNYDPMGGNPNLPNGSTAFNEDEIIKEIGAGNVSLPLKGTLIQGASSLFGLKLGTQFGRLKVTTIAAQQQSRRQQINIQQGGQKYKFQLFADQYDENRHFFFTQSNRDNYEKALLNLPQVNSLFNITYLEVWVTNDRTETQNVRDIIAFADLGEPERFSSTKVKKGVFYPDINGKPLPANSANNLLDKLLANDRVRDFDGAIRELTKKGGDFEMQPTRDFEKVRARKLRPDEYTYDPRLGYVSVNFQLRPNQTLGVAFTYKYNGKEFKVGELANNSPATTQDFSLNTQGQPIINDTSVTPQMLFVKLLKATTPRLETPLWDLMMKNIYSLGASNVNKEGFRLDIMYNKPGFGKRRFLPDSKVEGQPLLNVFNLDKLNVQGDPQPDGVFDFVEGITINTRQGKIIFPVLEPFGKALAAKINDPIYEKEYVYQQLYDTTVTAAREFQELNVFTLEGEYKGKSNSEYQLGTFNLPRGSVRVNAGGQQLEEGADFEVNYGIGLVKILNEAYVNSSVPVSVTFEDNQIFGAQQKRMFGARWDYNFNKNLGIGGTYMKLWEAPFTQKVNIGEDPVSNAVHGLDVNYNKDAPCITKALDRLPLISTKAPSNITLSAEGAWLRPGHSRYIDNLKDKNADEVIDRGGILYIDDFEGSTNGTDVRLPTQNWFLASVPQNDLQNNYPRFPEADLINDINSNANRAKLMWYNISENVNQGFSGNTPDLRATGEDANPYTGFLAEQELFPNKGQQNPQFGSFPVRLFDLTYRPSKRGPYNFDVPGGIAKISKGLTNTGDLSAPETRWAGIMRALPYNDFEASNVEFIDVWMLSPYLLEGTSQNKGKLHIDLGNVSEDILRDSRQFYENGLPGGTATTRFPTDFTKMARVPRIVPVTNAFDLEETVRQKQDVGLDGLNDAEEAQQFEGYLNKLPPNIRTNIAKDPANDNFVHFLDPSYQESVDGIYQRYQNFNNTQNNSKAADNNSRFVQAATNIPDSEDLDNNKSLDNEGESYFHYEIPIEFDNINPANPGGMNVQKAAYVVDIIRPEPSVKSRWKDMNPAAEPVFYRLRIPIDQFKTKVGGIQDFRSIRFMRMYVTDFERDVTLRFARIELARSQWRRYRRTSFVGSDPKVIPGSDPLQDGTVFNINAINFEENGNRPVFNYVLPPGVQREQVPGAAIAQTVYQNEQSISMNICNLSESSERGIYKNLNMDLRRYKQMKMFVHAENKGAGNIKQGEMTAFIRLGNDFERNYYEYEVPLTMSDPSKLPVNRVSSEYAREVWLKDNNFDINLEELVKLKTSRDKAKGSFNRPYSSVAPNGRDSMTIKGNPNLGQVRSIMIGVRNRSDVGRSLCAEVWVNELRVNGLDERGGLAGLARADIRLADVGRITAAANYTGIGYGGIEQRVAQRQLEQVFQYDVATNVELGKFLPKKLGLKIPMTYQFSNNTRTPEFDPYDQDIKLKDRLNAQTSGQVRDSLREQAVTVDKITNLSFDNVRVEPQNTNKKPMPWSISNFSVSYQRGENQYRDPIIASENKKIRRGQLDYNYSIPNGVNIMPFKKLIKKDKYLKLLSEFNFSPVPSTLSFNTNLERQFNTTRYRFTEGYDSLSTFYNKRFLWDRQYTMNWDFSKGLKMTYNSDAASVIDEPQGLIDTEAERDSIWNNVKNLGRYKTFNQNIGLNYTLPTKQIPFMDWINVRAQGQASYSWNAAALNTQFLGNTIRNTQNRTINGEFNFEQLYNQWGYLKKINTQKGQTPKKKTTARDPKKGSGSVEDMRNKALGAENADAADGRAPRQTERKTDSPEPEDQRSKLREKMRQQKDKTAKDKKDETQKEDKAIADKDGKKEDKDGKKDKKEKDKEKKDREPSMAERTIIRPLMLLRRASINYTENYQNTVPGFMPSAGILGQDNFAAPTWDFLLGGTPTDQWLDEAAKKNWITTSNLLNESVVRNYTQQIQGRATIEPFTDFKVDVELSKSYTENHTQDFKKVDANAPFDHLAPRDVGSYTVSYFSLRGMFVSDTQTTLIYQDYLRNSQIISRRLAEQAGDLKQHGKDAGHYFGYGRANADVAIPAFLAAYSGKDANTYNLNVFGTNPLPNYRLTYNGLGKLKPFKKKVQSINISHGYKSQLQVNSYNTNTPDFDPTDVYRRDATTKNYYTALNIPGVVMTREFSPLVGLDIKLKNDLNLRVDMKKRYNLQLSFSDSQLAENIQDDYTIGFAYKMKEVHLKFLDFLNFDQTKKKPVKEGSQKKKKSIIKLQSEIDAEKAKEAEKNAPVELDKNGKPIKKKKTAKKKKKGSDLNLKLDMTLTDGVTYQTQLLTGLRQPVRGDLNIRVSPAADYQVNKLLNLRFFIDFNSNKPKVSSSIPQTTIRGGIQLKFQIQ
jgi:cell surface protein SprA